VRFKHQPCGREDCTVLAPERQERDRPRPFAAPRMPAHPDRDAAFALREVLLPMRAANAVRTGSHRGGAPAGDWGAAAEAIDAQAAGPVRRRTVHLPGPAKGCFSVNVCRAATKLNGGMVNARFEVRKVPVFWQKNAVWGRFLASKNTVNYNIRFELTTCRGYWCNVFHLKSTQ
jgi:hypothetical protein